MADTWEHEQETSDCSDFDFDDCDDDLFEKTDNTVITVVQEEDLPLNITDDGQLSDIPKIVFVNDEDVNDDIIVMVYDNDEPKFKDVASPQTSNETQETFSCPYCAKLYKRKRFYHIHIQNCDNHCQKASSSGQSEKSVLVVSGQISCSPDAEFIAYGLLAFQEVFDMAIGNPFHSIAEPGLSVRELAIKVKSAMTDENCNEFAVTLLNKLWKIAGNSKKIVKNTGEMLNQFYNLSMSESVTVKWKTFLQDISVIPTSNISILLFNFILDHLLKMTIRYHKTTSNATADLVPESNLNQHEEESLYYIAGYLVFSLKKKINKKSQQGTLTKQLLDSWGSKNDDFVDMSLDEYTRAWVDQVNRGGLIQVNANFYKFVVTIEKVAQTVLNLKLFVTYCGENIRTILKGKLEDNLSVQQCWQSLCAKISNKTVTGKLLNHILNKWINVRANAFIKVWLQQYKWEKSKKGDHVAEQGEPSLRKSIGKKRKVDRSLLSPKKKKPSTPKKSKTVQAAGSKLKKAKRTLMSKKKL